MDKNKVIEIDEIEMKIPNKQKFGNDMEVEPQKLDNKPNYDNTNEIANDIEYERQKFKVPPALKKTFIVTVVLAGLGLVLFILGFIEEVAMHDPGRGITFWVLGLVVMIPGGYYSYQFWKAKRCEDEYKRNEILDQIPEL